MTQQELLALALALLPASSHAFFPTAGCAITPDGTGHVNVPSGTTSIAQYAYFRCTALKTISLPSSLNSVGNGAFQESGLTALDLSTTSLTSVSASICKACTSLASITFRSGLTSIGQSAFEKCSSLPSVDLRALAMTWHHHGIELSLRRMCQGV